MEKEFRREQHYAVSKAGILAHIKEAHHDPEDYYCPQCGCRMLKRCGKMRTWHFAHDWRDNNEYQKDCSYETYLHKYAKLRLKQWFEESDSIILHYSQTTVCKLYYTCNLTQTESCYRSTKKSCNLKQEFNNCEEEKEVKTKNGKYTADLLLTSGSDTNNNSRQLLIEIKVTHGCEERKKLSGVPIIEFDVSSEEDIDYIISHNIKESDKVRYYGFRTIVHDEKRAISPARTLQKFILYKSGKTFCDETDCQSILTRKKNSLFELITAISEENYWHLNLFGLMKAYECGLKPQNCFICKHYDYIEENERYKCRLKDTQIKKGSDALECSHYILNPEIFDKIKPLGIIDIWTPLDNKQEPF